MKNTPPKKIVKDHRTAMQIALDAKASKIPVVKFARDCRIAQKRISK